MQSFKEELPSYVENLDAGQFLQIVAPTCFWFSLYLPFAHAMHFVWSSINVYFPASQIVHSDAPAKLNVPGSHLIHLAN
jgi:hypothetical protein